MKYLFLLLCLTGCLYEMPTDDHIAINPNTNNPHYTGEKGSPPAMPGLVR